MTAEATPLSEEVIREQINGIIDRAEAAERKPAPRPTLASDPAILDAFAQHIKAAGLVGEERLAKIVYLVMVTRTMDKIVSLAVKGVSSSGKSYIVGEVLKYFPDEAYFAMTSMSEKALVYTDEDFRHRFIVMYEASGMESDMTTYLIRSLLSEGQILYHTVEKGKEGKLVGRKIEKPGPTGLIVTTTQDRLHPENETRLLSLTVTDTQEQTAAIMLAMAEGHRPSDLTEWHRLQAWIIEQDNRVTIPFGVCLSLAIPPVAVRLRRDFNAVLSLIRANAILHQASRSRDAAGDIIATRADYDTVRDLVADLVADAVEHSVPQTVRETVNAVTRVARATGQLDTTVSIRDLVAELHLDRTAVQRRVRGAINRGLLANQEERKGHPAALVTDQPLPDDMAILPEWGTFAEAGCGGVCTCARDPGGRAQAQACALSGIE